MTEADAIAVVLSQGEWRIVQEALDAYYYETEHNLPRRHPSQPSRASPASAR